MTLFEVRDLLKTAPATPVAVALRGKISVGIAEAMIDHWVHRGLAEEVAGGCATGGLCQTCGGCSQSQVRWFRWKE